MLMQHVKIIANVFVKNNVKNEICCDFESLQALINRKNLLTDEF